MSEYPIGGRCDERFEAVRAAFQKNFEIGDELGSSFALSLAGEMVVDLWGGFADIEKTRPWQDDTIVEVASSSKNIIGLCGLLLIDRGLIDLDEPVATYWPEFAAAGKERMPVRYIFCHATGLPALDGPVGWRTLDQWDEVVTRLAAQKPWWEPGTQSGYQPLVYGHLVGELLQRTTGHSLQSFFQEEFGVPLNIDFAFGKASGDPARMAEVDRTETMAATPQVQDVDQNSIAFKVFGQIFTNKESVDYIVNRGGITGLNIPAGNGITNARALAQAGSILALGGSVGSRRFLGEKTACLPFEEQIYTHDLVFDEPVRYGVGFAINSKEIPFPWPHAFHWGGAGGSSSIVVPEMEAAWAYTPSKFFPGRGAMDHRGEKLRHAVIECLKAL